MRIRALIVAMLLSMACLLSAPAAAGPQNGEVNHFTCLGQTDRQFWEDVTDIPLFQQFLDWIPILWFLPWDEE